MTARANVLGESIANPRLTGVWQSWGIQASSSPQSGDYSKAERDKKFVGWLASSADGVANQQVGFAGGNMSQPVTLWGNGMLGHNSSGGNRVRATVVPVNDKRGALAWAVLDEGAKALTHDVTTHSMGLFTDTARGGLRKDFHLLSNQTDLPTDYRGKGVHESLPGITAPSDPRWESLHQFARVHRDGTHSNEGGVPVLSARTPSGWARC